MPIAGEKSLVRSSAELLNRISRTQTYLSSVGPGKVGEFDQLWKTISIALVRIQDQVCKTLDIVRQVSQIHELDLRGMAVGLFRDNLKRAANDFAQTHELLVYLPRAGVKPETFDLMEGSIGNLYNNEHPSIILSSVLNAFEYDFFEIIKQRLPGIDRLRAPGTKNVVLELALCDRECPMAWAILAHELGHVIDKEKGITETVIKSVWDKVPSWLRSRARPWVKELVADIFAARTVGPASILAILSLEYSFLPSIPVSFDRKQHQKHPPTRWRLLATSEYLCERYKGYDFLKAEGQLFDDAWEADLGLRFSSEKTICQKRDTEENQYTMIIRMFASHITKEIDHLDIPTHKLIEQSQNRCRTRLLNHQPIGSQGKPREELQAMIWKHRENDITDLDKRANAFKKLLPAFEETPLDLPSILASGFAHRFEIFDEFYQAHYNGKVGEVVDDTCFKLDAVDEKIADSIRTARVHNIVLDRMQKHRQLANEGEGSDAVRSNYSV